MQSNRNKKFCLPPEFELMPEVKDFLKRHVFEPSSKKSGSSRKEVASSATRWKMKKDKQHQAMSSALNTKPNGDHRQNGRYQSHTKKKRNHQKDTEAKPAANGTKPESAVSPAPNISDNALNNDENVTFASSRERNPKKRRLNGRKRRADVTGDGIKQTDFESSNSSSDSDSRTSNSTSDSDSDDSSTSDSGDDTSSDSESWGEEDIMDDEREAAYAEGQRPIFRNINEFDLKDEVTKGFDDSQKQHNSLLGNEVPEIKQDIGYDWFDDKLVKTWQSFQRKKKKS